MLRRLACLLFVFVLSAWIAQAPPSASYTGPGDTISYTVWAGLRAYQGSIVTTGTAGLVELRRASDSATCAIIVSASGGLGNTAGTTSGTYKCSASGNENESVATFCNATTCTADNLYDQTLGLHCASASCDLVQSTAANQPTLVASCIGSFYCLQSTAASIKLISANNFTPATGVASLSGVGRQSAGTTISYLFSEGVGTTNNRMSTAGSNANWQLAASSGTCAVAAGSTKFHAGNGYIGSGSNASALNVDGTVTTNCTITGSTTAAAPQIDVAGSSATTNMLEGGFLDNSTFGATTDTSLCQNEQAYYGASNFGATC